MKAVKVNLYCFCFYNKRFIFTYPKGGLYIKAKSKNIFKRVTFVTFMLKISC